MNPPVSIKIAGLEDIPVIGYLAYEIWPVAYRDILSFDQLQYMLHLIYSPSSLEKQMTISKHQFLILSSDNQEVGFASFSKTEIPSTFKLHKLYVKPQLQGKGLGKALLEKVIEITRTEGANRLQLNVNRFNKARSFYEKEGFHIIKEEQIDIGNQYIMDDYIMEKHLTP